MLGMGDIQIDESRHRIYSNGAIFDKQTGRIVAVKPELATKNTQITSARTGEMLARRLELKRERIEAGALAAVEAKFPDKFTGEPGDWIEAVAEQVTRKALDPLDPKQVDAARFLLSETGIAEQRQAQSLPQEAVTDIIRELAAFAAQIVQANGFDNSNYRQHDAIDAGIVDADPPTADSDNTSSAAQGTG